MIEVGTIVRRTEQVRNYPEVNGEQYEYSDFILEDGPFMVKDEQGVSMGTFEGQHFVCVGATFYKLMIGEVFGLELINEPNVHILQKVVGKGNSRKKEGLEPYS